jgi:maltose O-acetyltransferase
MWSYIIQLLFSYLPDTRMYRFKAFLLRMRGFKIGNNVRVVSSVRIKLKQLTIGDNTFIGFETLLEGGDAHVQIGKNVDIAPRCVIVTGSHDVGTSEHRAGIGKSTDIRIDDGTWICASSTILGGVHIGKGCIVAAGSLVREDVDVNSLVAGVPARVIKKLP